jgi:DNA cross-link repair 1A protein
VQIVGFRPTGWTHSDKTPLHAIKPAGGGNVAVYGVPYSEHSSCEELRHFVQWLQPRKILPTVNNGSAKSRASMEALFHKWLGRKV